MNAKNSSHFFNRDVITEEHPEVSPYIQEFANALSGPTKISFYEYDPQVRYYYKYFKNITTNLLIIVKYLNGEGFIITAYFVRNIR